MLDEKPTLEEFSASKLHIINLTTPTTPSCSAFLSRCEPYHVTDDFLKAGAEVTYKESKHNAEPIEIDLFKRPCWKDLLFGDLEFNKKITHRGPLLQAIQQKKPLRIINPPENDIRFNDFLYSLQKERQVFYNGELIDLPDECNIHITQKPHTSRLKNVKVSKRDQHKEQGKPYYLNVNTLHECLEQIQYINGEAKKTPGLLAQHSRFYISGFIPEGEWQHLLHQIAIHYPNNHFYFTLLPGAEIEGVKINSKEADRVNDEKTVSENNLYYSNDPDFLTLELKKTQNDPFIIDINSGTRFSELVYSIEKDSKQESRVAFTFKTGPLLKELEAGRNVILNGEMNADLYCQLLPFLHASPQMMLHGNPVHLKGKLFSVQPLSAPKPDMPYVVEEYNWNDYKRAFENWMFNKNLQSIQRYFELGSQLPHRGEGRPRTLEVSYQRNRSMLGAVESKQPKIHKHNPGKGYVQYDYPKNSEDYAFLNVLGKCLFASRDSAKPRLLKLNKLFKQFAIRSAQDISREALWRCLNCLNGADLIKLFGTRTIEFCINSKDGFPSVAQSIIDKFYQQYAVLAQEEKEEKHANNMLEKRQEQLKTWVDSSEKNILFVKGNSSVGKTYAIKMFFNDPSKYIFIEENINKIFEQTTDKMIILFLDEANLKKPGVHNFLKALSRGQSEVVLDGKRYTLPKNLKIIAAGNPESFPGREYDPVWMHHAETLYFKEPDEKFLKQNVLSPILKEPLNNEIYFNIILSVCDLAVKHSPFFEFSIREVEDLAWRFVFLATQDTKPEDALYKACQIGFLGLMANADKRAEFTKDLQQIFKNNGLTFPEQNIKGPLLDRFNIPFTRDYWPEAIDNVISLHEEASKNTKMVYKHGMLVRGVPGIGKSSLYPKVLEDRGYKIHTEAKSMDKKYYLISAGTKEAEALLKQAAQEHAIVVLNELNAKRASETNVEGALNPWETSETWENTLIEFLKTGLLLASENPAYSAGRSSSSPAIMSRLNLINVEDYTDKELSLLAGNRPQIVAAMRDAQKQYPASALNARSFFTVLKKVTSHYPQVDNQDLTYFIGRQAK